VPDEHSGDGSVTQSATGHVPTALLLAGPNGAGKTTASGVIIPPGVRFLNADVAAAELAAGGHPPGGLDIAAGRLILAQIRELTTAGESFCVETNLAGRGFVSWINHWHGAGFQVRLAFVALGSPDLAVARVAVRVAAGGHDIPEPTIRRRWRLGLRSLFAVYLPLVDAWSIYDNTDDEPVLVARGGPHTPAEVVEPTRWTTLRRLAGA
jgi:predicted ABC-type ATPase